MIPFASHFSNYKSIYSNRRLFGAWQKMGGKIIKDHENSSLTDTLIILIIVMVSWNIHMSKLIKQSAVNVCSLLYDNYTPIKLLK